MAEHTHSPIQEHTTAGASMKKLLFKDGQSGACAAGQYYLRARPVSLRSRSCAHQARVSRAGPSCSRASPAPTIFVQVILCVRPVIVISVNILKQLGVNSQAYLVSRYDQLNIDYFGHKHKKVLSKIKSLTLEKPFPVEKAQQRIYPRKRAHASPRLESVLSRDELETRSCPTQSAIGCFDQGPGTAASSSILIFVLLC